MKYSGASKGFLKICNKRKFDLSCSIEMYHFEKSSYRTKKILQNLAKYLAESFLM